MSISEEDFHGIVPELIPSGVKFLDVIVLPRDGGHISTLSMEVEGTKVYFYGTNRVPYIDFNY